MCDDAYQPETIILGASLPASLRDTFPGNGMGALLTLNSADFIVLIGVDGWQPHEMNAIEQEKITLGLMRHHDCLVLLTQVGTSLMFDMTYDARKVHPDDAGIPPFEEDQGYLIRFVSFDSLTGQVVNLRATTVTPQFSKILATHVEDVQRRRDMPEYNFDRAHAELMRAFPSPAGMWEHCLIEEVGGQKFRWGTEDESPVGPCPR
jgi:hypothetical protein